MLNKLCLHVNNLGIENYNSPQERIRVEPTTFHNSSELFPHMMEYDAHGGTRIPSPAPPRPPQ